MLAVLVYAYCVGERSSRKIERRLVEDVAFRVLAANQQPDHATIARFRVEHQDAIAGLFGQVLAVCARCGLLRPGLGRDRWNQAGGERLPGCQPHRGAAGRGDPGRGCRDGCRRGCRRGCDRRKPTRRDAPPVWWPRRGRRARLRVLLAELEAEASEKSYEAHLARRAEQEAATGKPIRGRRPMPGSATHKSRRQANVTDPDSRLLKTKDGYVQGYNAQAVATTDQFVVAAEVTNLAMDAPAYTPMITAAKRNLKAAGERRRVRRVVADAGYWSSDNVALEGRRLLHRPGTGPPAKEDRRGRARPGRHPDPPRGRRHRHAPKPPSSSG